MNIGQPANYLFALLLCAMQCIGSDIETKIIYPGEVHISGKQTIPAPMGDATGTPIIKVYINQQGPYFFALASGMPETLISDKLAKKLNLPLVQTSNTQEILINKAVELVKKTYKVDKLQIGEVTLDNYSVVSMGGGVKNKDGFSSELRVDGLISTNAFYGILLTLDYKNEKIELEKGELSTKDIDVVPYSKKFVTPTINAVIKFVKLNKEISQDFMLSTGYHMHIFINACKIPEMLKLKREGADKSYDVYGNEQVFFYAQLMGEIKITDSISIKSPYVHFGQVNCDTDPVGAFGRTFFEKHKVTIDPKNRLIRIKQY
jgi:hypothetical protein